MRNWKTDWQPTINLRKFCLGFLGYIILVSVKGQEVIPAAGGNGSGPGGSVSFTLGQVVYLTRQSSGGIVSEGVQQTYEISVISGVEEAKNITLSCSVYPNPVIADLTLHVDENFLHKLAWQLYTIDGKLMETALVENSETTIRMGHLSSGLYFLRIVEKPINATPTGASLHIFKIFKIIKN